VNTAIENECPDYAYTLVYCPEEYQLIEMYKTSQHTEKQMKCNYPVFCKIPIKPSQQYHRKGTITIIHGVGAALRKDSDTIVAYLNFRFMNYNNSVYIDYMCTLPKHRRKGLQTGGTLAYQHAS